MSPHKRSVRIVRMGFGHFFRNHGMVYSAAVAFNILLSAIPILFLVFAMVSLVIGKRELPFMQLSGVLKDTFPYGAQVLVPNLRKLFSSGSAFGIVGTLLLLLSSFSATDAAHTSLAVMMGTPRRKRYARSALFHVVFVIALTVLTFAAILVPSIVRGFWYLMKGISPRVDEALHIMVEMLSGLTLAGVVLVGVALSYRFLSPRPVRIRNAFVGSGAFLVLQNGISAGYSFYIKKFSQLNIIYGSLFSVICFIIVAYLIAAAYLICASIIGVLERDEGRGGPPEGETGTGADGTPGGG